MNRKSIFPALSAFVLGISLPVHAQNATGAREPLNFSQLSMQSVAPARLQLKNLNTGWQRMTVQSGENDPYAALYGGMRGAMFQDVLEQAGVGVYFTRGQSVSLGGETFLVAYRIDNNMSAQDVQNLFRGVGGHGNDGPAPGPRKFSPDTTLLLSLLNLRTIGSLENVRPFDAKREIMGPADVIEASNENLQSLGGLLVKIQNPQYGGQALPLRSSAALRQTFNSYFHPRPALFVHPRTGEAYRTNAAAAKLPGRLTANAARVVAIYEARPGTDGKFGTVFLDGHFERVPQSRWSAVRAVTPQRPSVLEMRRLSDTNLRQLRFQLVRYARQRGGLLPRMQDISVVRREFANYLGFGDAQTFINPATGQNYRPNSLLSGKNLRLIANMPRLVAFYETTLASDGKRSAIFLDGHIERIPVSKWNSVRLVAVQMKPSAGKSKPARRSA